MTACTVIALLGIPTSGAAEAHTSSADSRAQKVPQPRVTAPVQLEPGGSAFVGGNTVSGSQELIEDRASGSRHCTARAGLRFYSRRYNEWRDKMGAPAIHRTPSRPTGCPRYLARVYRAKARNARITYERWWEYHYDWQKWMPDKLQRVGACETGYGQRPGNFHWDSGTYVSFAGIIRGGYAEFAHALGLRSWDESRRELGRDPTPREQVLVTLALQARYSWSAWGCGGA